MLSLVTACFQCICQNRRKPVTPSVLIRFFNNEILTHFDQHIHAVLLQGDTIDRVPWQMPMVGFIVANGQVAFFFQASDNMRSEIPRVVGSMKGGYRAAPYQRVDGEYKEVEIASISECAMAWEEAMLALGVDTPPGVDGAMDALLQVDGLFGDPGQSELKTMAAQSAVEPMVRRLKDLLDFVQDEVTGLMMQRAAAVGMELPADVPS